MLTFACARALRAYRLMAIMTAALALPLITFASARPAIAEGVEIDSCVNNERTTNCVTRSAPVDDPYIRVVPQPRDAAEQARANQEDQRWVEHCQPTIHQDRYGVARYHYARPGCEFGVSGF